MRSSRLTDCSCRSFQPSVSMTKLADTPKPGEGTPAGPEPAAPPPRQEHAERVVPYLARILQLHLLADPDTPYWTTEGTALFADVSGFTQLSEQLARKGREGAEQITDTIGGSFASILKVAYENGASLLKFGGERKSTRLNSSHVEISYAVFCLK